MEFDLFETAYRPIWLTDRADIETSGQDALKHDWPNLLLYAFPPLALLYNGRHNADSLFPAEQTLVQPVVDVTARPSMPTTDQTGSANLQ